VQKELITAIDCCLQIFPTIAVCSATKPLQTWYRVFSSAEYILCALFEAHASPEAAAFSHTQCHEVRSCMITSLRLYTPGTGRTTFRIINASACHVHPQVFEKAMKEAHGNVADALQRTFIALDKRFLNSHEPTMVSS
jgi:hypothetical protein